MRPSRPRADALSRNESPPTRTVPFVGLSRPAISLSNVVFPAPFGPKRATQSPATSVKSTPSTARRRPNIRVTPAASTAKVVIASIILMRAEDLLLLSSCSEPYVAYAPQGRLREREDLLLCHVRT